MLETKDHLNDDTLDAIQELTQINLDSAKIFRDAAKAVDSKTLPQTFLAIADLRETHATELQTQVRENRETPEASGTFGGNARRLWMDLRAAINGGDSKVILIEAERAEDVIKAKYEKLIKETAGSAMNDVLMRHYAEVKRHHDQIRDLRDAA